MGVSELFLTLMVGGLLFSKTATAGFVQGIIEYFKKQK
jgi:hypothetical protein